jgi:hypothetical protein
MIGGLPNQTVLGSPQGFSDEVFQGLCILSDFIRDDGGGRSRTHVHLEVPFQHLSYLSSLLWIKVKSFRHLSFYLYPTCNHNRVFLSFLKALQLVCGI